MVGVQQLSHCLARGRRYREGGGVVVCRYAGRPSFLSSIRVQLSHVVSALRAWLRDVLGAMFYVDRGKAFRLCIRTRVTSASLERSVIVSEPKPRKALINVEIQGDEEITLGWSEAQQQFSIIIERDGKRVSPAHSNFLSFYEGETKNRILSDVPFSRGRDYTVCPIETVRSYDHVWAIDTNRRNAFGVTLNVAALCAIDPVSGDKIERIGGMLFGKTSGNAECYGWRRWIEFIQRSADPKGRYAIIVDSEFGVIEQMNKRLVPVHGQFMLPSNFTIIYASDRAADSILNRAIKASHKLSNDMLKSFEKEKYAKYFEDLSDEESHKPVAIFCSDKERSRL